MEYRLKHKRNDQLNVVPSYDQLEYGELAINYNSENPQIFFRDTMDNVVSIGVNNNNNNNNVESDLKFISCTYEHLINLRNNKELKPNTLYRITDYVTTTSQVNTKSANHQFDILVTALTENTLSENAKACLHDNDDYFARHNAKLEAWEIKYCIDNDSDRFQWVSNNVDSSLVTINESLVDGFVFKNPFSYDYIMSVDSNSQTYDVEGNELFYEYGRETNPDGLENQLCIYKSDAELWEEEGADYDDKFFYYGTEIIDGVEYDKWRKSCPDNYDGELIWTDNSPNVQGRKYFLTKKVTKNSNLIKKNIGTGIIYYMKDEFNNECPYDFKNIMFYIKNYDDYFYTFSWINEYGVVEDLSVRQDLMADDGFCYGTYNNKILPYYNREGYAYPLQKLNSNVIICTYDWSDGIYYGCYNNIFGMNCYNNILGYGCYNNIFGMDCYNNILGHECINNIFGNQCCDNVLDTYCSSNKFDDYCNGNKLGYECVNNSFNTDCNKNILKYSCCFNKFNCNCYFNELDTNSCNNTFGDNCDHNTLGYGCNNNTFGNNCGYNTFRDDDVWHKHGSTFEYEGDCLSNVNNVKLSNNCSYLLFCTQYGSENDKLQNITVTSGVKGTYNDLLEININEYNNDYEIKIAINTSGDIKMYCEADLIN